MRTDSKTRIQKPGTDSKTRIQKPGGDGFQNQPPARFKNQDSKTKSPKNQDSKTRIQKTMVGSHILRGETLKSQEVFIPGLRVP